MVYRQDPPIEGLEISSYRTDDMLVDSSFLGIDGSPDSSLISQLKELIDSNPEIKSILARLKQRQSNRTDSVQYRTDTKDSMFSPALKAQIELAKSNPQKKERQDSSIYGAANHAMHNGTGRNKKEDSPIMQRRKARSKLPPGARLEYFK